MFSPSLPTGRDGKMRMGLGVDDEGLFTPPDRQEPAGQPPPPPAAGVPEGTPEVTTTRRPSFTEAPPKLVGVASSPSSGPGEGGDSWDWWTGGCCLSRR